MLQLFQMVSHPIIIETEQLAKNPKLVLSNVCQQLGFDWSEKMLSWPAGPKPYDGCWAVYIFFHLSRGGIKLRMNLQDLESRLIQILNFHWNWFLF